METGIPDNLFTRPFQSYKHLLTNGWIASVWEFVTTFQFELFDNLAPIPLLCQNDQFIIPALLQLQVPTTVLRQANICRLWLRVWGGVC